MTNLTQRNRTRLEIINPADCVRLLRRVGIGRLVDTYGGLPAVRLVNFVVDGDTIVFASTQGDKLRAAERGDVVAFEADNVEADHQVGWTVTVIGHLSVVSPEETDKLFRTLPLHSWVPMDAAHLIRLGIESAQGRRLTVRGQQASEPRATSTGEPTRTP